MSTRDIPPKFDFEPLPGYMWLVDRRLVGFAGFTQLQPWYYVDAGHVMEVRTQWPNGPAKDRLVVFARRQDNDDLACFSVADGKAVEVVLLHGWTSSGYDVLRRYDSFWGWVKAIIDDVAEWSTST